MRQKKDFDAVVVGSGPNGLAAAITLQQKGLSVLVIEGADTIGGGLRTKELTLPGFRHDVCSAIHPMAAASPFFKSLPLAQHGLEYVHAPIAAAHPLHNGNTALLFHSLEQTAAGLGEDKGRYEKLFSNLVKEWPHLVGDLLAPLHIPKSPLKMAKFGLKALQPSTLFAKYFKTPEAQALFAGMAAHSVQPLTNLATSAIALVLMANGHMGGWPMPKGGSQTLADALEGYFLSLGGKVQTGWYVKTLEELPSAKAVLFDVTPRQLLSIAGHRFSPLYEWQLKKYRHGPGVFKMDFAIEGEIPFLDKNCGQAATVHIGNTIEEIRVSEQAIWDGKHPENPFVLLAQQSVFDPTRAPEGKNTVWAYCHVPNGSTVDMSDTIERQVERVAPGFRERILARHTFNTGQLESYNPNYIGGDISGGVIDIRQLFTRPALRWSPYRTSAKGLYLCSSSTPPGGGVHGMCGYHAAQRVLKDLFR